MTQTSSSNIAQFEYWNTKAGETWAKFQEALDRQIETLGLAAMDTLKPEGGEHIIDIGCGCGQTSLDLGSRVGAAGSVVGVDISKPNARSGAAPTAPHTLSTSNLQST